MTLPRRAGRARWERGFLLGALGALMGCAGHRSTASPLSATALANDPNACPTSLRALAPRDAQRWLWLRPRALYEHPELGPLLSDLTRDAGERALLTEAERGGVDVRTVDRALLAWRATAFVALAAGAFDARRIIDLYWERMLPPRRRGDAGHSLARIEGELGGRPVALATDAVCGLFARAEVDPRLVDRLVDDARTRTNASDPTELIVWHMEGSPMEGEGPAAAALTASLRWTELRADPTAEGLRVTVLLSGPLPADTPSRMTHLLSAVASSPMGEAVGADDWLRPSDDAWLRVGDEWRGVFVVPWRGLRALTSLARGAVEAPNRQKL